MIAENQMLGMSIDRVPSMPNPEDPITIDTLETIFGIQRARMAAKDSTRTKKVGR